MAKTRNITPKEEMFVQLQMGGMNAAQAYRQVWERPTMKASVAAVIAFKVNSRPQVAARKAALMAAVKKRSLLTLKQRLEILGEIGTTKTHRPNERTRAIEVYTKIAGDAAPERHEITGAGGAPLQTETQVTGTIEVALTVKDKIAKLAAARR